MDFTNEQFKLGLLFGLTIQEKGDFEFEDWLRRCVAKVLDESVSLHLTLEILESIVGSYSYDLECEITCIGTDEYEIDYSNKDEDEDDGSKKIVRIKILRNPNGDGIKVLRRMWNFKIMTNGHNITRLLKKLKINLIKLPDKVISGQPNEVYKIGEMMIYDYWWYELILDNLNLVVNQYSTENKTFTYVLNEDERKIVVESCNF